MRHSNSETDAIMSARRRSQSMAEIKEHAYQRLQEELDKAQTVRGVEFKKQKPSPSGPSHLFKLCKLQFKTKYVFLVLPPGL